MSSLFSMTDVTAIVKIKPWTKFFDNFPTNEMHVIVNQRELKDQIGSFYDPFQRRNCC